MTLSSKLLPLCLLLLAVACDFGDEAGNGAPPSGEAPVETPARRGVPIVDVSRTLGTFEGEVTDIANVEAEVLGFEGRILAANGAAGVQMIQVDGQYLGVLSPVLREEKLAATLIAPSYAFGDEARVVQFVPEPDGLSRIELVRLDSPALDPDYTWSVDERIVDLCVAQEEGIVVTAGGLVGRFTVSPDVPEEEPVRFIEGIDGALRCFGTRSLLLVSTGDAMLDVLGGTPDPVNLDPQADAVAETAQGPIAVSIEAGRLVVEGTPVQVVDGDGLIVLPERVQVAGGNFGGILRDGAVVVLDEEDRLHLAPWSAVANGANVARTAIGRRVIEEQPDSDLAVEDDLEGLRPDQPLPGFEDRDAPPPPSQQPDR